MKTEIDNQGRVHNPMNKIIGLVIVIISIIMIGLQINQIELEKNKFILDRYTDPQELKNHIGQIVEIDDNVQINTKTLIKQQYEDDGQVTYKSIGIADIETNSGTIEVFYQTKSTNHRDYEIQRRLHVNKLQKVILDQEDRDKLESYIPYNETYSSMLYLEAVDSVDIAYFMLIIFIVTTIIGLFKIVHNPRVKQQSIDEMLYM